MKRKLNFILLFLLFISSCNTPYPYKENFEEITGDIMPQNSKISMEELSSSDFHGDYGSFFVVQLEGEYYAELESKLINKHFIKTNKCTMSGEFNNASKLILDMNFLVQYTFSENNKYYYVGFLTDKKSIALLRSSW